MTSDKPISYRIAQAGEPIGAKIIPWDIRLGVASTYANGLHSARAIEPHDWVGLKRFAEAEQLTFSSDVIRQRIERRLAER